MSKYYSPYYGKTQQKDVRRDQPKSSGRETTEPQTGRGVIVNAKLVNVRDRPSMDSNTVLIVREGDTVEVTGSDGIFLKVSPSSFNLPKEKFRETLYIHSGFVSLEEGR